MSEIYKKLSLIFVAAVLVSACTQNSLDKKNVHSVEKSTTNQVTSHVRDVTSSSAATSAAKAQVLKLAQ